MNYKNLGLVLLIPSTIFGIIVLSMQSSLYPIQFPIPSNQVNIMNSIIWIIGLVLLLKGISVNSKKKDNAEKRRIEEQIKFEKKEYQKKLNQEKEIKNLKDKVDELEKRK